MSMRLAVITGLFLLLIAAGGNFSLTEISARRAIPWDCTNWAAYAHEDRTTAILETLAENRGQTLYCGIDQSDTFTKAETWEAGRDRNERDNTIYWGERGNFRGFIAAQEGWLTEGESGITGQSTASIFEFPREERKRRRKEYRRLSLRYDREYPNAEVAVYGADNLRGDGEVYVRSVWIDGEELLASGGGTAALAEESARAAFRAYYTEERIKELVLAGTAGTSIDGLKGALFECRNLGYDHSQLRVTNLRAWWATIDVQTPPGYDTQSNARFKKQAHANIRYEGVCRVPK